MTNRLQKSMLREAYSDMISGLDDRDRDTDFRTDFIPIDEAVDFVYEMPRYNQFNPDYVAPKLDLVREIDPNARVLFGRESSPVIYIESDSVLALDSIFQPYADESGRRSGERIGVEPREGREFLRVWWD